MANSPGPSLRITEIMYDAEGGDEGKEYVEVKNTGPGTIDMTTVKFFEREERETDGLSQRIRAAQCCSREVSQLSSRNRNSF